MPADGGAAGALAPYRVLDLTDSRAELGPLMLADLGADVIKVEPPGGAASRQAPPLDPAQPDGSASLRFHAFNRNKRSVTLDLESDAGRAQFRRLVASGDFLFESAAPGAMAALGLGFDDLRVVNPRLIYVAITPFGQDGPYSGFQATDLTLSALSGQMAVYGDADRPPVRISVPQAWLHGAAESAVAAMVALQRRTRTGEAQFVDVSVQAALVLTAVNATIAAAIQGANIERDGSNVQLAVMVAPTVFRCAEGYVVIFSRDIWSKLVVWMAEEGVVPASWLADTNWATFLGDSLTSQPLAHSYADLVEAVRRFVARHPAQALFQRGLAAGVFLAPVNSIADVLRVEQLAERGYWQSLQLPDGRELHAPGPFVRLSGTPLAVRRAAPAPGADNDALLQAMPVE